MYFIYVVWTNLYFVCWNDFKWSDLPLKDGLWIEVIGSAPQAEYLNFSTYFVKDITFFPKKEIKLLIYGIVWDINSNCAACKIFVL
jgi:hypothetical protein